MRCDETFSRVDILRSYFNVFLTRVPSCQQSKRSQFVHGVNTVVREYHPVLTLLRSMHLPMCGERSVMGAA
jgi:hypothetical protein